MSTTCEGRIAELIVMVRRLNRPQSTTAHRKEIETIAQRLDAVADLLARGGAAQFEIEREHNASGEPLTRTGADGWPVTDSPDPDFRGYEWTKWQIRKLVDSARRAAAALPDSRERPALRYAARGLLHLRHDFEFPPPRFYNAAPAVLELGRVCAAAGIVLSPERLRGALRAAWREFDPQYYPPGFERLRG